MDIQFQSLKVGTYFVARRRGWVVEIMPKMVLAKDGSWKLEPEEQSEEFDNQTRYTLEEALTKALSLSTKNTLEEETEETQNKTTDFKEEEDSDDEHDSLEAFLSHCQVCDTGNVTSLLNVTLSLEMALDEQFHYGDEPVPMTKLSAPLSICRKCMKAFLIDFMKDLNAKEDSFLLSMCRLFEDLTNQDISALRLSTEQQQQLLALISLIHPNLVEWIEDHSPEDDAGESSD